MRLLVAALALAFLGAFAYAITGGSGGSPSSSLGGSTPAAPLASGVSLKEATTGTSQPVAETTSGSGLQRAGATRNPFAPLPGAETPKSATPSPQSTASGNSGATGSSGSSEAPKGSTNTGGNAPSGSQNTSPKKSSGQHKSQTVYHVAVLFGTVPPGTAPANTQLTPYENLKRQQPLPTSGQPLVVFRGVMKGGKSATFTLVGEAILRGKGTCLPSTTQCEAIELKPGQTEELEYVPQGGAAIVYQLQLASITSGKANASAARREFASQSSVGAHLLRMAGIAALPGLRYSLVHGVLESAPPVASQGRVHAAARGVSRGR